MTEPLQKILKNEVDIARIWAIGPAVMMKHVTEVARPYNIPVIVSLNTIMIDGTGMCGGCRVKYNQEVKFVCVDGPEFDGRLVDWDNLASRLSFYRAQEKEALDRWEAHQCGSDIHQPEISVGSKA